MTLWCWCKPNGRQSQSPCLPGISISPYSVIFESRMLFHSSCFSTIFISLYLPPDLIFIRPSYLEQIAEFIVYSGEWNSRLESFAKSGIYKFCIINKQLQLRRRITNLKKLVTRNEETQHSILHIYLFTYVCIIREYECFVRQFSLWKCNCRSIWQEYKQHMWLIHKRRHINVTELLIAPKCFSQFILFVKIFTHVIQYTRVVGERRKESQRTPGKWYEKVEKKV